MAIQQKLGLQARLSQRLILTPSLQQAIKLLGRACAIPFCRCANFSPMTKWAPWGTEDEP